MALTIPYTFLPGFPAIAGEVNENFDAVAAWANNANIGTDSLGVLQARTVSLPSAPTNAILYLNQTSSNPTIYISNAGTDCSLDIVQADQLASGKAVIKITDNFTQLVSGANEFVMNLAGNSTIPALLIKHGSIETFKVTKTHMSIPAVTTTERDAIVSPNVGSIVFNTSTQDLNVKSASAWTTSGSSPTGTVVMFAGAAAPIGWLICNGDTIPNGMGTVQGVTADFSSLYAILAGNYGSSSGTYKLPDMRGIFPTGAGTSAGVPAFAGKTYAGGVLGNYSVEDMGTHTHTIPVFVTSSNPDPGIVGQSYSYSHSSLTNPGYSNGGSPFNTANVQTYNNLFMKIIGAASCNNGINGTLHNSADRFTTGTAGAGVAVKPGSLSMHFIIKH